VAFLVTTYEVSQRRACEVVRAPRSMVRYRHRRPDDAALRSRLRDLASERRRFGYRRLNQMLKREGTVVNLKKIRRLYAEERLQVKRRKGRKKASGTRAPLVIPQAPDQRWSLDFVSDERGAHPARAVAARLQHPKTSLKARLADAIRVRRPQPPELAMAIGRCAA
jgi:putative transposase